MKNRSFFDNLSLYNNGEAVICNTVLKAIKMQLANNNSSKTFTPDTKMFTEAGLTMKDIAYVIFQYRTKLLIPFSYSILLEQNTDATIGDLAHSVWEGMLKAIQNN